MNISLEEKRLIEDIIHHADTVQSAEDFAQDQRRQLKQKIKEYRKLNNLKTL